MKNRLWSQFDVVEGDLGIEEITTKAGRGYGLTEDGLYVDTSTKAFVGGYVKQASTGLTSFCISPAYANANLVDFKAIAGHELIHATHYNLELTFNVKYVKKFSESIAYKYSVSTYMTAGKVFEAVDMMRTATRLGYWNASGAVNYYKSIGVPSIW